jgi:hypothetical protein
MTEPKWVTRAQADRWVSEHNAALRARARYSASIRPDLPDKPEEILRWETAEKMGVEAAVIGVYLQLYFRMLLLRHAMPIRRYPVLPIPEGLSENELIQWLLLHCEGAYSRVPRRPELPKAGALIDLDDACARRRLKASGRFNGGKQEPIPPEEFAYGKPKGWGQLVYEEDELRRLLDQEALERALASDPGMPPQSTNVGDTDPGEAPASKQTRRRSDEVRPDIRKAAMALWLKDGRLDVTGTWKERCVAIERHLGWSRARCAEKTLRRAIEDIKATLSTAG